MSDEKIIERDDKLVKSEKSWRRARIGAICLGTIYALFFLTALKERPSFPGEAIRSLAIGSVFWLVIIDWHNLRLGHIASIKLYRSKMNNP
jgi:hypothetical protein